MAHIIQRKVDRPITQVFELRIEISAACNVRAETKEKADEMAAKWRLATQRQAAKLAPGLCVVDPAPMDHIADVGEMIEAPAEARD